MALAAVPGYKPPILVVTQGEVVTVRFTAPVAMSPREVALVRGGDRVALPDHAQGDHGERQPEVQQAGRLALTWRSTGSLAADGPG